MSGQELEVNLVISAKVEKFEDGVSQEDIDNGTAVPYEVVESENKVPVTPENCAKLGIDYESALKGEVKPCP